MAGCTVVSRQDCRGGECLYTGQLRGGRNPLRVRLLAAVPVSLVPPPRSTTGKFRHGNRPPAKRGLRRPVLPSHRGAASALPRGTRARGMIHVERHAAAHGAPVGLAPGAGGLRGGGGLCPRQSGKGQQRDRQTGQTARYLTLTLARILPRIPTA